MRTRSLVVLAPLALFAACSGGNPLAGTWKAEALPAPVKKLALEFAEKDDRVLVHIDDPDHRHVNGHYTYDAGSKAVTVTARVLGESKAETWTGTLAGDVLELTGGTDKVKFQKGGSAH